VEVDVVGIESHVDRQEAPDVAQCSQKLDELSLFTIRSETSAGL
jgi:hypothetical protein